MAFVTPTPLKCLGHLVVSQATVTALTSGQIEAGAQYMIIQNTHASNVFYWSDSPDGPTTETTEFNRIKTDESELYIGDFNNFKYHGTGVLHFYKSL